MARKWSQERIVAAIRARRQDDPFLQHVCRDDPGLYYAAFRFFNGWRNAVEAAGAKPYHRKWTKERIVEAIRTRHAQGLPIRGITGKDPALYSTAYRHFGSWQQAMLAAGLPWKPKQWLSREQVLTAIWSRYQQGLPLCGVYKTDRGLTYAARRHFGSWATAVAAAGIPDGWKHTWNRERLIAVLQTSGTPGQPLASREVRAGPRRVASEYFGSWHAALAAAGRTPLSPQPAPHRRWTNQEVLTAIRQRSRQGRAMTMTANRALARAAIRRFGSWHKALGAAGVTPNGRRRWTPELVLEAIRVWHGRGAFSEGDQIADVGLMIAARRRFGGWHRALVAAGVRSPGADEGRRWKWPRQRIIEALQDRYIQGLPMIADHDKSLAGAVVRVFGSWHAGLLAAGIPVGAPPRPRRKWTREAILREIVARHARGLDMAKVKAIEHALACAACRRFGSWRRALASAGVVAERERP